MNRISTYRSTAALAALIAAASAPASLATGSDTLFTLEFGHAHVGLNFGVNPPDPRDRDADPDNDVNQFLNNDGGLFPHFADSSVAPPSNLPLDGPYAPSQVTVLVAENTAQPRPDFAELDAALGNNAGDTVYVLPELLDDAVALNVPWFSPEVEEDAYDQFDDPDNDPLTGNVTWSLEGVSGPGEIALWIADPADPFNSIELWMGSADGIDDDDQVLLFEGDRHNNWAFTEPGHYQLTFGFEAIVDGVTLSEEATFNFNVVPTPGATGVLGLAALAATRRRR